MDVILSINKSNVLDEVAKLTSYIGAKAADPGVAYNQVFTTPEDMELLERFWQNALDTIIEVCRKVVMVRIQEGETVSLLLDMPCDFDTSLSESLSASAQEYCINRIAAKWMLIADSANAELYGAEADAALVAVKNKIYARRIPQRQYYGG